MKTRDYFLSTIYPLYAILYDDLSDYFGYSSYFCHFKDNRGYCKISDPILEEIESLENMELYLTSPNWLIRHLAEYKVKEIKNENH